MVFLSAAILLPGYLAWKAIHSGPLEPAGEGRDPHASSPVKRSPASPQKDQILNNERAFSDRIKEACGWGADGFITRINEVDADFLGQILAESDPEKVLWDRETGFWMEVVKRYGAIYEKTQREQNHLKDISTAQWREPLLDIFSRRLELRGGGSVSQEMWLYLPGHIEYILGHMETGEARPPTHQQLFQETMQGHPFHLGIDPSAENRVAKVLSDLKGLETQMPARQAAFVRAEFDRFFKKEIPVSSSYQSSDPSVNDPETTNPGTPPHESKNTAEPPTKEAPQGNRRLSKLLKLPEYTGTPHTDQLDRPTTP